MENETSSFVSRSLGEEEWAGKVWEGSAATTEFLRGEEVGRLVSICGCLNSACPAPSFSGKAARPQHSFNARAPHRLPQQSARAPIRAVGEKVLGGSVMIFLFDTAQMSRKPQTSPLPTGVLAPVVVGTAWEELSRVNWPRTCPWTQTFNGAGIGDSGLPSDASLDSDAGGQEHSGGCPCSCPTAVRRMDGWQKFQRGRDVKTRATRHDTSWRSLELSSRLPRRWTDRGTSWEYTIRNYNISGSPALNSSLARMVLLLSDSDV